MNIKVFKLNQFHNFKSYKRFLNLLSHFILNKKVRCFIDGFTHQNKAKKQPKYVLQPPLGPKKSFNRHWISSNRISSNAITPKKFPDLIFLNRVNDHYFQKPYIFYLHILCDDKDGSIFGADPIQLDKIVVL